MMENLSKYFWLRRSAGVELQFFQIAMIGRGRLRLCLSIPGSLWQFTWNRFSGWIARSAFFSIATLFLRARCARAGAAGINERKTNVKMKWIGTWKQI
jgi:hypothetical protein